MLANDVKSNQGNGGGASKMKERRVGMPIIIGELCIIPLEEVSIHQVSKGRRLWIHARKEPIGVVVSSPHGRWAYDRHGSQVVLETYAQQIAGLQELLDSMACCLVRNEVQVLLLRLNSRKTSRQPTT